MSDAIFKPIKDWFSFENRCLVCGRKFSMSDHFGEGHRREHLNDHWREGVLENSGAEFRQVKAHPVGFPGPRANVPQKPASLVMDFSDR